MVCYGITPRLLYANITYQGGSSYRIAHDTGLCFNHTPSLPHFHLTLVHPLHALYGTIEVEAQGCAPVLLIVALDVVRTGTP